MLIFALGAGLEAPAAWAQSDGAPTKTLRGTVTDADTGETLPAASIFVEGTRRGTITNREGRYRLQIETLPATVVFRFVGYETERLRVTAATDSVQDVALAPAPAVLEEVTVRAERESAADIMRRVIAAKQERRERLRTFAADAYNRFVIRNDTGIVSVAESLTDFYWSRENGAREVVHSQRQTENIGVTSALPAGLFVTNLYDDEVNVAGYRLIGVTAPDALDHYRFRIDTVRALDDRAVFDIRVEPRNRLKSAFTGRISVLDEAFALLEAELEPARSFLFPPPIRDLQISYRQQFSNFGEGFWLPVSLRSESRVEVALPGLLSLPALRIEQVSRLSDYAINAALPDSLYDEGEDDAAVRAADLGEADAAAPGDSLIAAEGAAVVPLSSKESRAVSSIDSTQTLEEAFEPSGLLADLLDFSASVNGDEGADTSEADTTGARTDSTNGGGLDLPDVDLGPRLWYNRVEGGHLGVRVGLPLSFAPAEVYGEGGYQTARQSATYGAGLEAQLPGKIDFDAGYRYGVDPRYGRRVYNLLGGLEGRYLNSLRTFFYGGDDYFDYYGNERIRLSLERALPLPFESRLKLGVRAERHFSVEQNTAYDLLGRSNEFEPNPPIGIDGAGPDDGGSEHLRSGVVRLSLGSGGLGALLGVTGTRRLAVRAEYSPGGLPGNDFDFAQFAALADYRVETFLQRRLLPMTLDVRLTGSTFTGTVPVQRFSIVESRVGLFGALRTIQEPYEGEQHLAAFWEHNFRTAPFEALGLYSIAERGWNVLLFGGHARTWLAEARQERFAAAGVPLNVPEGGFHHEIGIGLSGLLGIARVDVAKRLDSGGLADGWGVSLGLARVF